MDELVSVMQEILLELKEINSKLDDIRGAGINSIDDICGKLDNIAGTGLYNSLADVCDKIDGLDTTITLGANY